MNIEKEQHNALAIAEQEPEPRFANYIDQQLSEKLNGVEEKQFDEQVLLEEQIAALESQLAVTVTGGGGRDA